LFNTECLQEVKSKEIYEVCLRFVFCNWTHSLSSEMAHLHRRVIQLTTAQNYRPPRNWQDSRHCKFRLTLLGHLSSGGNRHQITLLSQTACRVLAISASSAQSERDFLSVRHALMDICTRLSAHKVESIELVRWRKRAGLLPPT